MRSGVKAVRERRKAGVEDVGGGAVRVQRCLNFLRRLGAWHREQTFPSRVHDHPAKVVLPSTPVPPMSRLRRRRRREQTPAGDGAVGRRNIGSPASNAPPRRKGHQPPSSGKGRAPALIHPAHPCNGVRVKNCTRESGCAAPNDRAQQSYSQTPTTQPRRAWRRSSAVRPRDRWAARARRVHRGHRPDAEYRSRHRRSHHNQRISPACEGRCRRGLLIHPVGAIGDRGDGSC